MHANFSRSEEQALEEALRQGEDVACPRCDGPMERRRIPPSAAVSYVRDRVWLLCAACGRSAVVDRRREEAGDEDPG